MLFRSHLGGEFDQQSKGRSDLVSASNGDQVEPSSYENIRDRVKAKLAQQTFHANPGATFQSYAEETESDEEVVSEEEEKEYTPSVARPTTWKKEYLPIWDKLTAGEQLTPDEALKLAEYTGVQRESEYKKGVST